MKRFKIKKRDPITVDINKTSVSDIFALRAVNKGRMIYATDQKRFLGTIGTTEAQNMRRTGNIEVNKNGFAVIDDEDCERKCTECFNQHMNWMGIPVINNSSEIVYEYIYNQKEFYDELLIDEGCGINHKPRKEHIILSMTTHDERLQTVYLALKSLMCQSMKADRICLYLAKGSGDGELVNEEELTKAGVEVIRGVEDITCHKKYYYAMKDNPDSVIITADDDNYYDDGFIEDLYKAHCIFPDAVICKFSERIRYDGESICPYITWDDSVASEMPESQICIKSYAGVLYPVGDYRYFCLNKGLFKHLSQFNDDLWMTACMHERGIKMFNLGDNQAVPIAGTQETALWTGEETSNRNDVYVKNLREYFGKAFKI